MILVRGRKDTKMSKKRYNSMFAPIVEPEEESPLTYPDNRVNDIEEPEVKAEKAVFEKPKPVEKEPEKWLQATTDVNFRLTPDIKRTDNIIGVLKKDLKVKLLEDKGEWKYVEFERKRGYIKQEYLKEV